MKKIILFTLLTLAVANGYSQEKGKFRVGLDLGFLPANGGGGIMFAIEPKFNLTDNMNVGLRIGGAGIIKDLEDSGSFATAKISASSCIAGTYDYYFHKSGSGSSFSPYIGAGFGYYSVSNVEIDNANNELPDGFTPATAGVIGGLIRGGFEWGKFRMGVEYNILPESDLENLNGNVIGKAQNAYLGIHLGFYLGGGKWGK